MKKNNSEELNNVLNNQLLIIENQLAYLENISVSLRNNPSFRLLANITPSNLATSHYFHLQDAQTYMKDVLVYPSLIKDAHFLFEKNDLLISNNFVSDDFSREYLATSYFEGLSYNEYRNTLGLLNKPYFGQPMTLMTNEINSFPTKTFVLPYIIPTSPSKMFLNYDSALISFIDIELLENLLLENTQYNFIKLVDDKDVVLHSFYQDTGANNENLTIIETNVNDSSLKLIAGIDKTILLKPLRHTILLIQLFFMGSIIISIIFSLFLSYKNNKPFKNLLDVLPPLPAHSLKKKTIFDAAIFTINSLSEQKQLYVSKIDTLKVTIKSNLFDKLIHGRLDLVDVDTLNNELTFLTEPFILIIARFTLHDVASKSVILSDQELAVLTSSIISSELDGVQYIHDVLPKQSIIVVSAKETFDRDALPTKLGKISNIIQQQLNHSCFFSISDIGYNYKDIFTCHEQALGIVRLHYPLQETSTIFYTPSSSTERYVELNDTQKLHTFIIAGKFNEIETMLKELQDRLLTQCSISNETLSRIYHTLQNVIIFAAKSLRVESEDLINFQEYSKHMNVATLFNNLTSYCLALCEVSIQNKESENTKIITEFKTLIDCEYTNPNLSIPWISDELNISEKYLCTYIKDNMGISIGDYIEDKRMKQAMVLLGNNKLLIKDIATTVGFNSQNTFYKAFKRYTGLSPGAWRSANKSKII